MVVLPPVPSESAEWNTNYILFWNSLALDLNRLTVSLLNGPGNTPPSASRYLAILHIAINDAYFAIHPDSKGVATTYLTPNASDPAFKLPDLLGADDAEQAIAGVSITVLHQLYTTPIPSIPFATNFQKTQNPIS